MNKVGFAGLGSMGNPMARNLLQAGFPTAVYDTVDERVKELANLGARPAMSPREAAADADVFVVMVLNYSQAEEVVFGPAGAAQALRPGAVVILMSTVSPVSARRMGEALSHKGIEFLDSPVSGGHQGAEAGTLTLIVGGPSSVLEQCRGVLAAMGTNIYHAGETHGSGEAAKIVNNLLCGVSLAATAEALMLAAKLGVDPRLAHDVILHGTGDCWMARARGPRMLAGDFTTTGRLDIFVKDLGAALEAGGEVSMPLPLAKTARELFEAGVSAGWGAEDDSAVIKVYESMAGMHLSEFGEMPSS